jgi:hypothetical protein
MSIGVPEHLAVELCGFESKPALRRRHFDHPAGEITPVQPGQPVNGVALGHGRFLPVG